MEWYEITSLVLFAGLSFVTVFLAWAEGMSRHKVKTEKEKAKAIYKETSIYTLDNVCDACGKYPKQPNSMLCKECEVKAYDNSDS